ncbi:LuxR C-terminal-related transcriptional regulator [Streptomyces sp. NPDC002659]|uniref:LuxR C-terminal-related transcriptional regulator n=1 Tax=Streptomyces sp. NPDC002659 TaxID=3364656 RepID=UPI00369BCB63
MKNSYRPDSDVTAEIHSHYRAMGSPAPPVLVPTGKVPLVGREMELMAAVHAMTSGSDRYAGIVIAAPPGVGKTRLSEEVAKALPSSRRTVSLSHSHRSSRTGTRPSVDQAAVSYLERLSSSARSARPVVLIDDAHHLDAATAELLRNVAQRRSVDLLVTVSSDLGSPAAIVEAWNDRQLFRVDLRPLDADTTRHLATTLLSDRLLHTAASRLAAMAEGNPQLLRELVRAACERGMVLAHPEGWDVADGVPWSPALRELLRQRLHQLNCQEERALDLVALAEPAPLSMLESLVDSVSLVGLEDRHLIRVGPPVPQLTGKSRSECPSVRIGFPLLGHFLRNRMPVLKRRTLLRTWIDTYEQNSSVSSLDQLRLMDWRLQASLPVRVQELLEAAQLSHQVGDLSAAARFTESAWRQQPSPTSIAAYGRALVALGCFASADHVLETTAPDAAIKDVKSRSLLLQGRFDDAHALGSHMAGTQLQHHHGMAAYFQGRFTDALRISEPLLAHGDPALRQEAGILVMAALCHAGRPLDALHLYQHLDVTQASDEQQSALQVHSLEEVHANALADSGKLVEAQEILIRLHGAAVSGDRIMIGARHGLALGLVLLERGRPRQALPHLTLTSAYDTGWDQWRQRARIYQALARAALPDRVAAARVADSLPALESSYFVAHHAVALAWAATARAERAEATALLEQTARTHHSQGAYGDVAILVHEMARLGMSRHTSPFWDMSVQGPFMQARLNYGRALATKDPELLHHAAGVFAGLGADLYAAEAYADLARLHEHSGNERRATAARLQATSLAAGCEGAITPALQRLKGAQPLSARESEITVLVAQGLTDKEIAERLTISVRTVGNHLYRIYRKLGVDNRRALRSLQTWH